MAAYKRHNFLRSHNRSSSIHQKAAIFAIRRRGRASMLFLLTLAVVAYLTIFRSDKDGFLASHLEGGGVASRFLSVKDISERWRSKNDDNSFSALGRDVGLDRPSDEEDTSSVGLGLGLVNNGPEDSSDVQQKPLEVVQPDSSSADTEAKLEKAARLLTHTYNDNGLLTVNPDGPHPLYELITSAEKEWAEKLDRASKTLDQAVKEYVRRYGRQPPVGFDRWWKYVKDNKVQLPDEYDQIHRDLEPFWAIDPQHLQASQRARETGSDSYTIGKLTPDSRLTLLADKLPADRRSDLLKHGPEAQMALLEEVERELPMFRATFTAKKEPDALVGWEWMERARAAARTGKILNPADVPAKARSGWAGACPDDSALAKDDGAKSSIPLEKSFIYDHHSAMDICSQPDLLQHHGQFLRHATEPSPKAPKIDSAKADISLAPLFSQTKTNLHSDILFAPVYLTAPSSADILPWDSKADDRLFWRGSPTGIMHSPSTPWQDSHRARLLSVTHPNARDSLRILPPTTKSTGQKVGRGKEQKRGRVNAGLMDVAFVGDEGCEGPTCAEMKKDLRFKPFMPEEGEAQYKYVLDIDGDSSSSRFRRLMAMNSLIFKSTIYPEWFTDRIQPWVHYVPVQIDYSDLHDSVVFFGGDLSGTRGHSEMAKNMGIAGKQWAEKFWRTEDIVAYNFRLYLEYARVMSTDRETMYYGATVGKTP